MATTHTILLIDDEADILKLLDMSISRMGFSCQTCSNVSDAYLALKDKEFSLCITDKNLPDGDGMEIIEHIQKNYPDLPVAMITAYGSLDTAIDAMKAGAFDYITKPIDFKTLENLIISAIKSSDISGSANKENNYQIIGNSESIKKLEKQIDKVAKSQAPVFIHGESGSGKELVARTIHYKSNRFDGPFIAVNCGAIPSELVESEFFGHLKGSFTGANEDKPGVFSAANGGTLFLDEVADLPLSMQVKLLRAIQERAIRPIGGTEEIPVDVRILSASHKDLPNEITEGNFREDLYYRINVIDLEVPSLRERDGDIELITDYILEKIAGRYNTNSISITNNARKALSDYQFPGNVRELENILERAYTLCEDNEIDKDDLSFNEQAGQTAPARQEPEKIQAPEVSKPTSANYASPENAMGDLEGYLERVEREALEYALEKAKWNKTAAAESLGISFRTMRYKLKKLNIE